MGREGRRPAFKQTVQRSINVSKGWVVFFVCSRKIGHTKESTLGMTNFPLLLFSKRLAKLPFWETCKDCVRKAFSSWLIQYSMYPYKI